MTPLGTSYKKNTFYYEQVIRDGDVAIFKQRLRPGAGCLAYEVIRIKEVKETKIFGTLVPAHESAPGNEEWGVNGWTYPTLARAKAKMAELLAVRETAAKGAKK